MILKITVKTPKNQAKPTMERNLNAMLGINLKRKLLYSKIETDCLFYWIIDIPDKDYPSVIKNAIRGEVIIKKFYSMLIGRFRNNKSVTDLAAIKQLMKEDLIKVEQYDGEIPK